MTSNHKSINPVPLPENCNHSDVGTAVTDALNKALSLIDGAIHLRTAPREAARQRHILRGELERAAMSANQVLWLSDQSTKQEKIQDG